MALSQQPGQPWLRFSVAVPLGITPAGPWGARDWSYPNDWQPLPYFNLTLRTDAREAAARATLRVAGASFLLGATTVRRQRRSNEPRRVAARRAGWRTARLCEPQKLGQQINPKIQHNSQLKTRPILLGSGCALRGGPKAQRAGPAVLRTAKTRPTARPNAARKQAQPSSPPRVRLHCGSAFAPPLFRAPARFNYFGSPPKQLNRFFRRWRAI